MSDDGDDFMLNISAGASFQNVLPFDPTPKTKKAPKAVAPAAEKAKHPVAERATKPRPMVSAHEDSVSGMKRKRVSFSSAPEESSKPAEVESKYDATTTDGYAEKPAAKRPALDAAEDETDGNVSRALPRGQGGKVRTKTPAVIVPASISHSSRPGQLTRLTEADVANAVESFDDLGLDARLVRKLTADKELSTKSTSISAPTKHAAPTQGAPQQNHTASAIAGIVRGHLKDGFGLIRPTRVQRMAIPKALKGESLFIRSETGSGKTLTYLLPIVQRILLSTEETGKSLSREGGTLALILGPTRELCTQIFTVASRLLQSFPTIVPGLIVGGEKRKSEKARLRKGVHILIATPGRLLDHLRTTASFQVSSLQTLVLDEADRLLDLGFDNQVREIVSLLREKAGTPQVAGTNKWSTYLISATLSAALRKLAVDIIGASEKMGLLDASFGADGEDDDEEGEAEVKLHYSAPDSLQQQYVIVPLKWRLVTILSAIAHAFVQKGTCKIILFLSTTSSVDFHYRVLSLFFGSLVFGDAASARMHKLHGNMSQSDRVSTFREFAAASSGVLVATDVASRGLDLPAVDVILQADPPSDTAEYVHRVGRTARRGESGRALLMLQPHEVAYADILVSAGLKVAAATTADMLTALSKAKFPMHVFRSDADDIPSKAQNLMSAASNARTHAERAEMNAALWQYLAEEAVLRSTGDGGAEPLAELARTAFLSFIRAYAAHEKSLKHIFHPRALHLGHAAKAFGLRETPTDAVHKSAKASDKAGEDTKKPNNRLSFSRGKPAAGSGEEREEKRPAKKLVVNEFDA